MAVDRNAWAGRLDALARRLDAVCLAAGIGCLLLMLGCVLYQIVARYLLHVPPAWTEELGRYAMIWAAMAGATCAYYRRLDPTLSAGLLQASPRRRALAASIDLLAIALFVGPVLYFTPATIVRLAARPTDTLGLSTGLVVAVVPAAMAIVLVHAILRLVTTLLRAADDSKGTSS